MQCQSRPPMKSPGFLFCLNILLIFGEYNGKRKQRIKEASMSKTKDSLIEITINLVVALAVISTVLKVSL